MLITVPWEKFACPNSNTFGQRRPFGKHPEKGQEYFTVGIFLKHSHYRYIVYHQILGYSRFVSSCSTLATFSSSIIFILGDFLSQGSIKAFYALPYKVISRFNFPDEVGNGNNSFCWWLLHYGLKLEHFLDGLKTKSGTVQSLRKKSSVRHFEDFSAQENLNFYCLSNQSSG